MVGFSRNETAVLLFLIITFIAGMGVWFYRTRWAPLPEILVDAVVEERISKGPIGVDDTEVVENDTLHIKLLLNSAEREDLEGLPGIGATIAGRIVEYRRQHGEFYSLDELLKIKGIGPKTLERIKPYLKLRQ